MTLTFVLVRLQHAPIDTEKGASNMCDIFESGRIYDDTDHELDLIGSRSRRAQWRHKRTGPSYFKIGRKVKYAGDDLNAWFASNKVVTNDAA
ncbi:hypothetical protein [Tateyamaria sp. SN6-1]|uniref:hypothetical protein n=1 Tax=Tateyamaria sp. SN6-1 TaxID=3092148 RepID=UPI0039F48B15